MSATLQYTLVVALFDFSSSEYCRLSLRTGHITVPFLILTSLPYHNRIGCAQESGGVEMVDSTSPFCSTGYLPATFHVLTLINESKKATARWLWSPPWAVRRGRQRDPYLHLHRIG